MDGGVRSGSVPVYPVGKQCCWMAIRYGRLAEDGAVSVEGGLEDDGAV